MVGLCNRQINRLCAAGGMLRRTEPVAPLQAGQAGREVNGFEFVDLSDEPTVLVDRVPGSGPFATPVGRSPLTARDQTILATTRYLDRCFERRDGHRMQAATQQNSGSRRFNWPDPHH